MAHDGVTPVSMMILIGSQPALGEQSGSAVVTVGRRSLRRLLHTVSGYASGGRRRDPLPGWER
jgi:hypothetical protein